jgi:hypothetical protein
MFAINMMNIIKTSLMRALKYSSRGFNCMNGVKEYFHHNLANLYLNIKGSSSNSHQQRKFEGLFRDLILMEDNKVFTSIRLIYRFGIQLYTETINDGVPNLLYLADDALNYNESEFSE